MGIFAPSSPTSAHLRRVPLGVDGIQLPMEQQQGGRKPRDGSRDGGVQLPVHYRPDPAHTSSWNPGRPLYSTWLAPVDFEDNGERTGLASSVLTFDGKPVGGVSKGDLRPEIRDEGTASSEMDRVDERVPAPRLLPSARHLATLMNYTLPMTPVDTPVENKFKEEYYLYFRPGSSASARDHQRIDYAKWSSDWNNMCERIEKGSEKGRGINRKTSGHLQSYATTFKDRTNFSTPLTPFRSPFNSSETR